MDHLDGDSTVEMTITIGPPVETLISLDICQQQNLLTLPQTLPLHILLTTT